MEYWKTLWMQMRGETQLFRVRGSLCGITRRWERWGRLSGLLFIVLAAGSSADCCVGVCQWGENAETGGPDCFRLDHSSSHFLPSDTIPP